MDVGRYLTAKGNMGALADGDHVSVALCSRFVFCVALAECILKPFFTVTSKKKVRDLHTLYQIVAFCYSIPCSPSMINPELNSVTNVM